MKQDKMGKLIQLINLDKCKYSVLAMYAFKLEELNHGHTSQSFEMYEELLKKALPLFSEDEQAKYLKVLDAGSYQMDYVRAKNTVRVLDVVVGEGSVRKKTIDDFLMEMNSEKEKK